MKKDLSNIRRGTVDAEPPGLNQLENPLEFIKEDHMHMRAVCQMIDRLAGDRAPDPLQVTRIMTFLDHEIGLLIQDEDDDLRDLLLARCSPDDDIVATLDRLKAEHDVLAAMLPVLREHIVHILGEDRAASEPEALALREFADRLRRHLLVENAIVLPIARARLTEEDVAVLRAGMIRRRITDMQG